MSERQITCCDECDAERKEANHWFSAFGEPQAPSFATFDAARAEYGKVLADYCGQQCAVAAFQRFLNTGTLEKEVKS